MELILANKSEVNSFDEEMCKEGPETLVNNGKPSIRVKTLNIMKELQSMNLLLNKVNSVVLI